MAEHLTHPDFKQKVGSLLRVRLRAKFLYKLAETRCIELIEDIVEILDTFNNTRIDAQVCGDSRSKIRHVSSCTQKSWRGTGASPLLSLCELWTVYDKLSFVAAMWLRTFPDMGQNVFGCR